MTRLVTRSALLRRVITGRVAACRVAAALVISEFGNCSTQLRAEQGVLQ